MEDSVFIQIRLSHLLGQNGVGSLVRSNNVVAIIKDIETWGNPKNSEVVGKDILYVERIKCALKMDPSQRLIEPPIAEKVIKADRSEMYLGTIPALRFPFWTKCPRCGKMFFKPWKKRANNLFCDGVKSNGEKCNFKGEFEQIAWVLINKEGHISDVPWKNFVHNRWSVDEGLPKNNCQSDQLYFIDGGNQSSRQTVATIKCIECGTSRKFTSNERGAMFFLGQPWTWIGSEQRKEIKAESGQPTGMVVAINDSRVYRPDTRRLLVIPPESRLRQGTVVDQLYRNSKEREEYEKSPPGRLRDGVIKRLGSKFHCSKEEVISAFEELERGYPLYGETFSTGITMEAEYDALLENYTDQREDEDFVVEHCSTRWHELSEQFADQPILHTILHHVNHLVKVKRLKVIHVFKGFSRGEVEENSPPTVVSPTLCEEVDWYPAMELYGEGIFLTLEEKTLATWEKQVEKTVCFQAMLKRYEQFGIQVSQGDEPSPLIPRHILLHTLSHLLIRQFEMQCGYPAASLSERIYSDNSNKLMAGILIYTAVPDIAGSLGGLVELSEPTTFLNILSKAIEHAQWCSLDPICCEHEAHGPALLNYAACHACALLPETSCDFNNNLLDRNFIIGHAGKHLPPFFDTTSKDK